MSGFATEDINRRRITVKACALVYTWWTWQS